MVVFGWKLGSKYIKCQCDTPNFRFLNALTSIADKLGSNSVIIRQVYYLDCGQDAACVDHCVVIITIHPENNDFTCEVSPLYYHHYNHYNDDN